MSSYDDPYGYEEPEHQDYSAAPPPQPASNGLTPPPPLPGPGFNSSGWQSIGNTRSTPPFYPVDRPRPRNYLRQILLTVVLLAFAFLGGWFSHAGLANSFSTTNQSQSYAQLIQQAWTIIDQHYVDRKAINYKQMSYQAIRAFLAVLNDKGHTRFLTPADVQAENQQLSGTFTGIGIYLHQDPTTKQLIITSTIPGSPAEKTGFKRGDILIAVNGVNIVGKDIDAVSSLIQGTAGTSVAVTVQRPSTHQTLTIHVVRAQITVPNVIWHYISQDHIAHIQIVQFAEGVSDQLKSALIAAKKDGATSIILDLRDDPGGYLSEAVNTASEFIASGNVLLEQNSTGQRTPDAVTGDTVNTTIPIVVLVNNNTASAAEIVSGALQDNQRAIIMGTKTFGTGTVLQEFPLADGSAVLLGTSEWLTPKGHFIRDNGITPTITVPLSANANSITPDEENAGNLTEAQILSSGDEQMVAAIHYLETHKTTSTSATQGKVPQQSPSTVGQLALELSLWNLEL